MRIEALCTGDELLTGLTTDTNSTFFTGRLNALGEKLQRLVIVGDVREDIIAALIDASRRAEAVLVSGGLGPTTDDLTAECAAAAAGVKLVEHGPTLAALAERFKKRGLTLTPNNARQALVPEGAEVVRNPAGSAPMFILKLGGCRFFFVPGVPREYMALVEQEVLPRLKAMIEAQPSRVFRASVLLKTVGIAESHLDQRIRTIADKHPRIVWGYRTHAPENHLKIAADARSQAEADAAMLAAEVEARQLLGSLIFGGRDDELAAVTGALLARRGETVGLAESCTGGLATELLTAFPGASRYVRGGVVAYQPELKTKWARVSAETIVTQGVVSEAVALELARGARIETAATYGLGITGYAGPDGGSERDPVGTVYCALATPGAERCQRHVFIGDRDRVRAYAAFTAIDMLRLELLAAEGKR